MLVGQFGDGGGYLVLRTRCLHGVGIRLGPHHHAARLDQAGLRQGREDLRRREVLLGSPGHIGRVRVAVKSEAVHAVVAHVGHALGEVLDPELKKDLVSLGMIKDIAIDGDRVSFEIQLTTPACPLRSQIETSARNAVEALSGVSNVEIEITANVPVDSRIDKKGDNTLRNTIAIASGKGGVGKTTIAV